MSAMKRLVSLLLMLVAISIASAEPIVIIVRHAEKADNSEDAELSPAGRERAEILARMLKDANVTAIFTSERKRTQQTAAPLAKLIGVSPNIVGAKDYPALAAKLREVKGNALVVGHGNTIPDIIKTFGIDVPIQIADPDYSQIFVVALDAKPRLMQLRYP